MSLGDNTIRPFLGDDAREAAHQASEIQRGVEDQLRNASRDLAEKDRRYREAHSIRIVELHADEQVAWNPWRVAARARHARERHPAKTRVRQELYNAVRRGDVVRPHHCEECGVPSAVEGHHADYDRPLGVEWLCHDRHVGKAS